MVIKALQPPKSNFTCILIGPKISILSHFFKAVMVIIKIQFSKNNILDGIVFKTMDLKYSELSSALSLSLGILYPMYIHSLTW